MYGTAMIVLHFLPTNSYFFDQRIFITLPLPSSFIFKIMYPNILNDICDFHNRMQSGEFVFWEARCMFLQQPEAKFKEMSKLIVKLSSIWPTPTCSISGRGSNINHILLSQDNSMIKHALQIPLLYQKKRGDYLFGFDFKLLIFH